MKTNAKWIVQSRAGGRVERCHGVPHAGSYSNAAHSWGVAMLMFYLWPEDFPRLAGACLAHDVPEAWVGDVPAPTMRYLPGLRKDLGEIEDGLNASLGLPAEGELAIEDHVKLKACDRLELYLWCREQLLLGNQFVGETLKELKRFFSEVPLPEEAMKLFRQFENMELLPVQAGVMKEVCGDGS